MASTNVSVKLTEWRGGEIEAALREAARSVEDDVAATMADIIRATAPVESGRYKEDVHTGRFDDVAYVYTRQRGKRAAFYSVFDEYGTRFSPPQPVFRPAMELAKPEFKALAEARIGEVTHG